MDQGIRRRWSNSFWMRFGLAALLVILIPLVLKRWVGLDLLAGLTGVTALILLAYTVETHEMRRQMVLQNEIAIQPLVIAGVEIREVEGRLGHGHRNQVVLRNIGFGPALFVHVKEIEIDDAAGVRFVRKFADIDCIAPGKDSVADVALYGEIEGEDDVRITDFVASLDPHHANKTYEVTICYEDINGQKHESLVRMGKGGIKLLRHGKV